MKHISLEAPLKAEEGWLQFVQSILEDDSGFFQDDVQIVGARAPGRLDVLGGVSDYSGGTVLEMPIGHGAYVAWQWRSDRIIRVKSVLIDKEDHDPEVEVPLDSLLNLAGELHPLEQVRQNLTHNPRTRWASYVVGCFYIMLAAYSKVSQGKADSRLGERGANVLLYSEVPQGAGVSSSAAIEVAVMLALSEAAGIHPSDLTLASWCQKVENQVVGAPCGIMDQVTSALGRENALLTLRCQPHDLLGNQHIPPGWKLLGIDSGVKHSVDGSPYVRARVAAFMGLKIIQLESGGKLLHNYLARMSPSEFAVYKDLIPEEITGAEYTRLYGRLPDTVTHVEMQESYTPRAAAEYPILENERVQAFVALMHIATLRYEERREWNETSAHSIEPEPGLLIEAGELMYAAHDAYSKRLDLGSPETDHLVKLIKERGVERGLFGARISGGGSGGVVAVLCRANSQDTDSALQEICSRYNSMTGITPDAIVGSSPGAVMFGARRIKN